MKKLIPAVFLIGSVALVYFILGRGPSSAPLPAHAAGGSALSGPGLDGKTVSLSDFAGKVVLVDFWATWCGPCKAEIPELIKLQDAERSKGFVVLGVSMDEEKDAVAPFLASRKVNYPMILLGSELAPSGWSVPGLPTAFLVGKDGKVIKRYLGSKDPDQLRADVDAALAL